MKVNGREEEVSVNLLAVGVGLVWIHQNSKKKGSDRGSWLNGTLEAHRPRSQLMFSSLEIPLSSLVLRSSFNWQLGVDTHLMSTIAQRFLQ